MRAVAIRFVIPMLILSLHCQAAAPDAPKPVPFETYDGHFVTNKFEAESPASFVVIDNQKLFDSVFGAGFVMNDKRHRLPKGAFDSKLVISAIKRGKATCEFKVQEVTMNKGVVTVKYAVIETPHATASFANPLILSVPKGDYEAVQFVENDKPVQTLNLKPAPAK